MINDKFWEEVKNKWVVAAPEKIKNVKTSSGGAIDSSLLINPWDMGEVPFEMVDYDKAIDMALTADPIPLIAGVNVDSDTTQEENLKQKRPTLNTEKFDNLLDKQTLSDYISACFLLKECDLPEDMDRVYIDITDRLKVLNDTMNKFKELYQPDMTQFYEYYIPETLQLTATYLEYLNLDVENEIILETKDEIIDSAETLLVAINDTIEQIYQFATIQLKAKAKALETTMNRDGYADPNFRITND